MKGFAVVLSLGLAGFFASGRAEAMPADDKPCEIRTIDARNPFGPAESAAPSRAGCHHARRLDMANPFAERVAERLTDPAPSAELEVVDLTKLPKSRRRIDVSNPFDTSAPAHIDETLSATRAPARRLDKNPFE